MPDAIITSTASTFGTISGTFAADQSTIVGTVAGSVVGNLSGSVGVPGPAGPGVPAGGTAGQYLQKIDGVDYNTDWVTLNLSAYAPLNSPAFTGDPTAPTAALGDNDTSLATTAFVQQELASGTAVAKNLEVYVRNQTGSTLAAGAIVYINGATGNRPTVTLAQANNDANSAQTFGFVKTAIANNGFGYVIVRGELENIDTSALTEGVQLYLSPTTPGAWTTTKPSAPQHLVYVGIVVRSHPTQGVILVAVQNGYELNELHDVAISSPTNGQVLKYNSATNLWKNQTDSSGVAWGGITGTLSSQTDLQTALDSKYSTSNPAGYITSSALTPYLTSATAASTYQTIAGMSSYLTTSSASATYQTISGMNAYLTTSAAASTYLTQANAASTYFTIANAANKADLASPVFTGDPRAPTPATADNDTSIATTAFVKAQGYLTSAPVTSVAGKTGAVSLVVGDVSGAAPLASPALSGTPTSTTASPGTNTTQIATTAFVTAAVPAFATETQAIYGTSSTTTISPLLMRYIMSNGGYTAYTALLGNYSSYVSGSGSIPTVFSNFVQVAITAANGKAAFLPNNNVSYHSFSGRGVGELTINWTKPVWFSFRFNYSNTGQIGDANTINRVTIGKVSSTFGDLSSRGIGVRWTAGTAGAFTVMGHNGTTLSTSASAVTVSNTTYFPTTNAAADFLVYSDGAGNVTLFCNNVQVATTTGGPSSGTSAGVRFTFETDNTTSTSGTVTCDYSGIRTMLTY